MSALAPRLRWICAIAAVAHLAFLVWFICPYAGGSDSSGYLNSAKLLRSGQLSTPMRVPASFLRSEFPDYFFTPAGFRPGPVADTIVPTYPVGLPLHLLVASWVTGLEQATVLVNVLATFAFATLLFLVAREFGVRPNWAASLALLLTLSPLSVLYALQPMSDLLAATWALALVWSALRSHRHRGWAAAAGLALAVAVLVRPTNVLLAVPALVCLRRDVRTWLMFAASGLPVALALFAYNRALYGSAFATGYGSVSGLFQWGFVPKTLAHYAIWLPVVCSPLVLAALRLPWVKSVPRHQVLALAVWAGVILGPYAAYFCTHEVWWYLRFTLPALPALGIAAALALQDLAWPEWRFSSQLAPSGTAPAPRFFSLPVSGLLLAAALAWMIGWGRYYRIQDTEVFERPYRDVARWIDRQGPDALCITGQASGALMFYSDKPFLLWHEFSPARIRALDDYVRDRQLKLYIVHFAHENHDALPGPWRQVERFRDIVIWERVSSK